VFIAFDGIDGCGKSTLAEAFEKLCTAQHLRAELYRDPGGTPLGSKIRELLLNKTWSMTPLTQSLLFTASRHELAQKIMAEREANDVQITDRWLFSTLAYQCYLQKVPSRLIWDLYAESTGEFKPDVYVIVDIDANTALRRKQGKPPHLGACAAPGCKREVEIPANADRFESMGEAAQEVMRQGFLYEMQTHPTWTKYIVLDGQYSQPVLLDMLVAKLKELQPEPPQVNFVLETLHVPNPAVTPVS
jgi:dTMP kinase